MLNPINLFSLMHTVCLLLLLCDGGVMAVWDRASQLERYDPWRGSSNLCCHMTKGKPPAPKPQATILEHLSSL